MDIAITSHKELIQPSISTSEDKIQTETPSNFIIKAAEKPSNHFQIPTLPSEFVGQKFGVYVANLNWVCCYFLLLSILVIKIFLIINLFYFHYKILNKQLCYS